MSSKNHTQEGEHGQEQEASHDMEEYEPTTSDPEQNHLDIDDHSFDPEEYGDYTLQPGSRDALRRLGVVSKHPTHLPPEVIDHICHYASQRTLRQTIGSVCKAWHAVASRFVRRKGTWTMGSQQCEDDLLVRITTLSTLCVEISPASSYSEQTLYGRAKPFDKWSMAWERFVKVLTEPLETTLPMLPSPSQSSLPTPLSVHEVEWDTIEQHLQEANRHGKTCLLHYLDRIVLSGTQVPRHLGSLLPSFSLVRSLEMTLKDAAYLNLSEIFEHCINLRQLNIVGPHNAVVDLFLHHYHDEDSSTGEEPHLRLSYPKLTSLSLQKVKMSQKTILTLINAFPGLTTLHILYIIDHDSCYRPVPSLVRLDLRVLYNWVAQACPNLHDVYILQNSRSDPDRLYLNLMRRPSYT